MALSNTAGEATLYIASDGGGPSSSTRKRCAEVTPGTATIAARWPRYHTSHSAMRDGSVRPLSLVKIIAQSHHRPRSIVNSVGADGLTRQPSGHIFMTSYPGT